LIYERTADVEFSTLYAYGYIASKAMITQYRDPWLERYCDEELEAGGTACRCAPSVGKVVVR
jgi:hypothetical protein